MKRFNNRDIEYNAGKHIACNNEQNSKERHVGTEHCAAVLAKFHNIMCTPAKEMMMYSTTTYNYYLMHVLFFFTRCNY